MDYKKGLSSEKDIFMIFIKICLEVLELLRQTRNKLPTLWPAILDPPSWISRNVFISVKTPKNKANGLLKFRLLREKYVPIIKLQRETTFGKTSIHHPGF